MSGSGGVLGVADTSAVSSVGISSYWPWEMIVMVASALLIGIGILTVVLYVFAQLGRRQMRRATEKAFPPAPAPFGPDGELAEVTLVSARLAGELSPEEYQWGMALLAAGDAVQHPLEVPPELSA